MFISIIIPTYNEEKNIAFSLKKCVRYLHKKDFTYEVIISDDGSTDNTRQIVKKFVQKYPFMRILKNKHTGKASTVIKGMLAAKGDVVLFTDADFATPIETIDSVIALLPEHADVVIGSRTSGKRDNEPLKRKLAGKIYNILAQAVLLRGIDDTQAGFKAFSKEACHKIFSNLVRFKGNGKVLSKPSVTGFDIELIFLARHFGYSVASIPIQWEYKESQRVNLGRDSIKLFFDLFAVKWYSITGRYAPGKKEDATISHTTKILQDISN